MNIIPCDSRPDQLSMNAGQPTRSNPPLGMNKDWGEKDTDARRWRRGIEDRRRGIINPFTVAILPIITAVAVIPTSSVLVMAISMPSLLVTAFVMFIIFGEGRPHVETADHCG